jgi:hypothetical protein
MAKAHLVVTPLPQDLKFYPLSVGFVDIRAIGVPSQVTALNPMDGTVENKHRSNTPRYCGFYFCRLSSQSGVLRINGMRVRWRCH